MKQKINVKTFFLNVNLEWSAGVLTFRFICWKKYILFIVEYSSQKNLQWEND